MLRYFETSEARKGALLCRSWRNTGRSIQSNNHGKYRCELTQAEVLAVEEAAGAVMECLGYTPSSPALSGPPSWPVLLRYFALDTWWRFRAECGSLGSDRNHWLRWRRDLTTTHLRLAALLRSATLRRHSPEGVPNANYPAPDPASRRVRTKRTLRGMIRAQADRKPLERPTHPCFSNIL
jgi:hypothetical protein